MKRTVNIDKEYQTGDTQKAINKFFKTHSDIEYWKETLEWMLREGVEHFVDDTLADGSKTDWSYSIWLYPEETYTYIAVIERA